MNERKTVTIHYIKGIDGPSCDTDRSPFEGYEILHTERTSQDIEFIKANAADFVIETFTLDAADRKKWGWLRIDDEFGDWEATEHTVLIPVREMTNRETEDWCDEQATKAVDDLIDGAPSYSIARRISNRYDIEWEEARDRI